MGRLKLAIEIQQLPDRRLEAFETRSEGHFFDLKSKRARPARLEKHISAFANADGGEIAIGYEDPKKSSQGWQGFADAEEANSFIAHLDNVFGTLGILSFSFLEAESRNGLLLLIEIEKAAAIVKTSGDDVYLRRGAQSIKQDSDEKVRRIEIDKGLFKFENTKTQSDADALGNTETVISFMLDVVPAAEPGEWLQKQKLTLEGKTTIAGELLFSDEPQVEIPKAAIKIYRYKTQESEGTRKTLDFDPEAVEGCAYSMIYSAVSRVKEVTENIPILGATGFEKIAYPDVALHEVITNAVIHRDYSIDDDVHVRIFDNRVEVESPGKLPAHITAENILDERFARNPKIVRILNKFKDAPNKDVGEGLNTTFQAMRAVRLRDPEIQQLDNSVLVTLKHESLASAEEVIIDYLQDHDQINNSIAREICFIGDANKMKRVFQKLQKVELIERIPGLAQHKAAYRKGKNFPS